MDKLVSLVLPNGLEKSTYDPNDGRSCVRYYICCSGSSAATISFCTTRGDLIGEEEGDDLAGDILSNVLNGDNDEENDGTAAGDDTNTQIAIPIITQDQDQDQEAANLALNEALDSTVEETPEPIPEPIPTPECPTGFALNSNNGQCERTVTEDPECPTEFTFNPETDNSVISCSIRSNLDTKTKSCAFIAAISFDKSL